MIGQTISHYKILEKLGEGGMGVVYKAEDLTLKRIVALKFLPHHLLIQGPEQARFLHEAQAASALNHPNVCHINAIVEVDNSANPPQGGPPEGKFQFIDMEYIDGRTLHDLILHPPLPNLQSVVSYAIQIGEALQEAHAHGIIHRDIKSNNIMVNSKNQVKVMDFGLAKLKGSLKLTKTSSTVGTLAYMAPEQLQGGDVDARSDIFSFGVVLYEMLTGKTPFQGEHEAAIMYSIVNTEPEPLEKYRSDLSPIMVNLIQRALEKNPDDRYQSASDLLIELRRTQKQTSKVVRSQSYAVPDDVSSPHGSASPQPSPAKRHAGMKVGIVAVVLLVAALIYSFLTYFNKTNPAAALQLSFTQLTDLPGIETNPDISPDGNFIVYEKDPGPGFPDRICLQRVGGGNPINLSSDPKVQDAQPAFSPDGQMIAFRSERSGGGIFLMGATGENVRRLTDSGYNPAWSPDGKEIAYATQGVTDPNVSTAFDSELWRIMVATGEKRKIKDGDILQPQWSPHGQRIAYWEIHAGGRRDIFTIPAAGGDSIAVTDDAFVDWNPVWSPDGKYLYFSSDRGGSMNLWRIAIDEQTGKTSGEPQPVTTPSRYSGFLRISRDGRRLIYSAIEERANLFQIVFDPVKEVCVGEQIAVTQGTRMVVSFDLSPDGEWIAFCSGGSQEDVFVISRDGKGLRQLTNDFAKDRLVLWSPDGKKLAFMSDRSGKYDVWSINSDGSNLEQLTKTSFTFLDPVYWLNNGKNLVCTGDSGVLLFDLTKPLSLRRAEYLTPAGKNGDFFWGQRGSPDGKWLAGSASGAVPSGIVVYSMQNKTYESITDTGAFPIWLNDNRRLLYDRSGKLFIVDIRTKKTHEIANTPADALYEFIQISKDNHSLYYDVGTKEADLWLVTMQ